MPVLVPESRGSGIATTVPVLGSLTTHVQATSTQIVHVYLGKLNEIYQATENIFKFIFRSQLNIGKYYHFLEKKNFPKNIF